MNDDENRDRDQPVARRRGRANSGQPESTREKCMGIDCRLTGRRSQSPGVVVPGKGHARSHSSAEKAVTTVRPRGRQANGSIFVAVIVHGPTTRRHLDYPSGSYSGRPMAKSAQCSRSGQLSTVHHSRPASEPAREIPPNCAGGILLVSGCYSISSWVPSVSAAPASRSSVTSRACRSPLWRLAVRDTSRCNSRRA